MSPIAHPDGACRGSNLSQACSAAPRPPDPALAWDSFLWTCPPAREIPLCPVDSPQSRASHQTPAQFLCLSPSCLPPVIWPAPEARRACGALSLIWPECGVQGPASESPWWREEGFRGAGSLAEPNQPCHGATPGVCLGHRHFRVLGCWARAVLQRPSVLWSLQGVRLGARVSEGQCLAQSSMEGGDPTCCWPGPATCFLRRHL